MSDKKQEYESVEVLRDIIKSLDGRKFMLDCGHKVTFGHNFANNLIIDSDKDHKIICTLCGY